MNAALVIIISATVLFGLLPLFLRSSAVLIFLALSAGELLSRLLSQDATQLLRSLPATNTLPLYSIVQIVLLLTAPLLILLGYRNSSKPSQMFLHVLPAIASVLICVMLVTAKLPYETKQAVESSSIFTTIQPFFSVAVAAGLLSSTLYLIAYRPRHHDKHKNQ